MKKIFLSALAGLLISLSFPNTFLPFVYLGGFFILFMQVERAKNYREAFLQVFTAGFTFTVFSFYWIVFATSYYGDVSLPVSALMLVVFSAVFSLFQFVPFGTALYFLRKLKYYLFLAPFLWTALEVLREFFPFTGFPWNLLGYTLSYINPVAQVVSFGSVYSLSFLAVFFAVAMYLFYRDRTPASAGLVLFSILLFAGLFVWGKGRIGDYRDSGIPKNIAVIQGNITEDVKLDESSRLDVIAKYLSLIKKASEYPVDLIILPESAVPVYPLLEPADVYQLYFFDRLKEVKKPLLAGFDNLFYEGEELYLYNSVFLIDENGKPVDYYSKIKLVPFGEYVPSPFGFLRKLFPYLEGYDFFAGKEKKVLKYREFKIVPLVCFEAIFPVFVGEFSRRGNLIVNITNDAWFGRTSAPFQHFEMARVRAIENNRYLVRAANTGISAVINPVGKPVSTLNLFEEGIILDRVYLIEENSFWNSHYPLVALVFFLSFLLTLGTVLFLNLRKPVHKTV
ncbi:MAG: apolipoprotein N-acyltransferase [Aquificae bacterium]|nr:apolipoprotein N-acyltransferase [Aquificota bacterium]